MDATRWMREALRLARKGYGRTSPNPMVGALVIRGDRVLGRGWHRGPGLPHAEVEALADARRRGHRVRGATLIVTLEPCSTWGRTPPCTDAILAAGIRRVIVGAVDPNPRHAGRGLTLLRDAGVEVHTGVLADECAALNEAFNHWIVHRRPWVIVKAAMTLDGKIATATGESQWITGPRARAHGWYLRRGSDAVLVGVETVLADDPSLLPRGRQPWRGWRVILDARARTPRDARVTSDNQADRTIVVVGPNAPPRRVDALAKRVTVWEAPLDRQTSRAGRERLDLAWLLDRLGQMEVTRLLVEGGGEVQASFLLGGLAHRVAFYYAPLVLGGADARRAVAGEGARSWDEILRLRDLRWRRLGPDLLLEARVEPPGIAAPQEIHPGMPESVSGPATNAA
ncbi:bifunctional diaminohydroxyphosphoribosylaminopyrimidine deaminase/5-amino-6-(5-phosphoribosylamino)uracil reductase RibD [Limisphaera ngatamarikiensis]|uniref:Riboflavin biosynthesis protein RibD n=1 Tax=Limisphaera ngatamarikiensis TaxID=1324935 RepID=A0A6M1RHN1_9BACT|nr:bifunctional diaminohydroxyphosphoribosylaminopyrimidine deaminase/5-amino-6-(5-phosphoribosylamino)uracil reductase RibD [Limisphaera ngatamarikiensis]NGO39568.1 bifunctional diaminohydroxyphosphoribosylaminopyrimidine deaminase/5-amino-6-(5-phosphoribosylamino)uracil reductase RibD [Limisphaera ngatamarikiensis]